MSYSSIHILTLMLWWMHTFDITKARAYLRIFVLENHIGALTHNSKGFSNQNVPVALNIL